MPVMLTPILTDGILNPEGNTFVTQDEADTYFGSGMSHADWKNDEDGVARETDDQARALVGAFRALNRLDYRGNTLESMLTNLSPAVISRPLREAQLELALHFLVEGRPETGDEDEIKALRLAGALSIDFNKSDKPKPQGEIPDKILLSIRDFITLPGHLVEGGLDRHAGLDADQQQV